MTFTRAPQNTFSKANPNSTSFRAL